MTLDVLVVAVVNSAMYSNVQRIQTTFCAKVTAAITSDKSVDQTIKKNPTETNNRSLYSV